MCLYAWQWKRRVLTFFSHPYGYGFFSHPYGYGKCLKTSETKIEDPRVYNTRSVKHSREKEKNSRSAVELNATSQLWLHNGVFQFALIIVQGLDFSMKFDWIRYGDGDGGV